MKSSNSTVLWAVLIILFLLIFLFPLYPLLKIVFSEPRDIFQAKPSYLIQHFTFNHLSQILRSGQVFWGPLQKSLVVAIGTTFLSLLIGVPAAFSISRLDIKLRYVLVFILFMSRMLPEVSIALPISIRFIKMGLFDTSFGLILAHLIKVLPVSCFLLVNIFGHFPKDLFDQALIDGCDKWQAFTRIVLPLTRTGLVVTAIFSFLLSWDEFIYASYLSLAHPTMPIKMYYYIARGNIFYTATYALIIMGPVFILSFFIHKHMKSEQMAGALSG